MSRAKLNEAIFFKFCRNFNSFKKNLIKSGLWPREETEMPTLPQKSIFGCKLVEQSQKRREKASSRCPPGLVNVMNLNLGEPHPSYPPALGTWLRAALSFPVSTGR